MKIKVSVPELVNLINEIQVKPRNGSYPRGFCIKGIGEVGVKIPRDRKGEFQTQVHNLAIF